MVICPWDPGKKWHRRWSQEYKRSSEASRLPELLTPAGLGIAALGTCAQVTHSALWLQVNAKERFHSTPCCFS